MIINFCIVSNFAFYPNLPDVCQVTVHLATKTKPYRVRLWTFFTLYLRDKFIQWLTWYRQGHIHTMPYLAHVGVQTDLSQLLEYWPQLLHSAAHVSSSANLWCK